MVKFPFDLGKHLICQLAEVRSFRNVLAYQPVRVLVCATLPGVVWVCEVELGSNNPVPRPKKTRKKVTN